MAIVIHQVEKGLVLLLLAISRIFFLKSSEIAFNEWMCNVSLLNKLGFTEPGGLKNCNFLSRYYEEIKRSSLRPETFIYVEA